MAVEESKARSLWVPARAGTTGERQKRDSTSAADRFLRLAETLGRERSESLEQFVDLLRRSRINVEAGLARFGDELRVLHRGRERVAQRLEAVGRNPRRARQRPAEQKLPEMNVEHRAVLV